MFAQIFKFELQYHRHQYLIYTLSAVFFLLLFLATSTPNVQMVGGVDNLNLNASYTVVMTLASFTILAMFGSVAFSANGIVRDFEHRTSEMFFTTPVTKFDYVYGRFFGSLVFTYLLYFAGLAGVLAGELMPWLDAERIGDTNLGAYLFATLAIGIPNLFVFSALFFLITTRTKSMMGTYVAAVGLLMLSFLLDVFTEKATLELTSILDPFGISALEEVTRYWTVFEKNHQVPVIEGAFLINRVLWMMLGLIFLACAYPSFSFTEKTRRSKASPPEQMPFLNGSSGFRQKISLPVVALNFSLRGQFNQYFFQTALEFRNIVRSAPFVVLLLLGLLMVVANATGDLGNIVGTSIYPTTTAMVGIINGAFSLSLVSVLIYYSSELLVRERNVKVNEIMDAMPYPNWVMMAAKLSGLALVVLSMLFVATIAAICVQLSRGYYQIDILHYLAGLFFFFQFPLYLMMVLSVFFYVLTRSKYLSMFLMIVYIVLSIALPRLGFENYLYRLRAVNPVYSDFTGYSQNLVPYLWQSFYWGLFGCLLLIVIHLMWPRGIDDAFHTRIEVAMQRLNIRLRLVLAGVLCLFVGTGIYMFYNTNIVNDFVTQNQLEANQASYEINYKEYEFINQPVVTKVFAEVDIFPGQRDVYLRGNYAMVNNTDLSIETLHLSLPDKVKVRKLEVGDAELEMNDAELGYRIYRFSEPLQPGKQFDISFEIDWLTPGFANSGHGVNVASNGTFINNLDLFPLPGYQRGNELQDNNKRREHLLPPLQRAASIDDQDALYRAGLSAGERVSFEAIVSTSDNQIAIAPGYLQKSWTEQGRTYFHYKMDAPIWNFFSFVSADYQVRREKWHAVDLEIYYLHNFNVDTMLEASKHSLDYFSENFSPYQYRQFRIMEFPAFQGAFAQSFPNTIPFSEAIGFVADLRDESMINYVYYVTAHEFAHQWWAHQVLGADVQGATMIVESLAQYSALMVMEEKYGAAFMKRFLEYELDKYLSGRGGELIDEMPLFLVENQPYIHYRKGSVVLYALKDYIGEDAVNSALAEFLQSYAFKSAPYPTTLDLLKIIRRHAPGEYSTVITDLFEKIVLFDLKVEGSLVQERPDGKFEVTIDIAAKKYEAEGNGVEHEVPVDAWVDIGVLGEIGAVSQVHEVLHLEKVNVTSDRQTFNFIVDKAPVAVGIDPMNKLVDRNPADNIKEV